MTSLSLGEVQELQTGRREPCGFRVEAASASGLSMSGQMNQSRVYVAPLCGRPVACISKLKTSQPSEVFPFPCSERRGLWALAPTQGVVLTAPTYSARRAKVSKTWLLPRSLPQELAGACGVS